MSSVRISDLKPRSIAAKCLKIAPAFTKSIPTMLPAQGPCGEGGQHTMGVRGDNIAPRCTHLLTPWPSRALSPRPSNDMISLWTL